MNKLRPKSNFTSANLNSSNFWPSLLAQAAKRLAGAGIGIIFAVVAGIILISQAAASQSYSTKSAEQSTAKSSSSTRTVPAHSVRRPLTVAVTVRNPHCPACFKTLKSYLLALAGVQAVNIKNGWARTKTTVIVVSTGSRQVIPVVINRIKAHDLEILNTQSPDH